MSSEPTTASHPIPSGIDAGLWLDACRRIVVEQRKLFGAYDTILGRSAYEGVGAGGDHTLVIDRLCEEIIFVELERLHAQGVNMKVIAEERGEVLLGDGSGDTWVIVDPIDGSLNARRTVPSHSLSIAVASGPSLAQVEFGYVFDFGAGDEFWARKGEGAWLNDTSISLVGNDSELELVALEGTNPARILPMLEQLVDRASRIRVLGSIAISVCYVAAGRFDAMLTARACRSVDVAAAQLILREAGGVLEIPGLDLESAGIDLGVRYHILAAVNSDSLDALRGAQSAAPPAPQA